MHFLILAVISSAAIALVLKYFNSQSGNRYGIIIGNYLTCILISLIMIRDLSLIPSASGSTFVCGAIGGLLFVAGLVFMQSSINANGATLTSAFGKLGVMVPLAISFICFGEKPAPVQIVGILIAISSLIVINSPSKSDTPSVDHASGASSYSFALLILVFLGNGLADSMAKVFERVGSREDDKIYIMVVFTVALIISSVLAFFEYRKTGSKILIKELLAGIAVGVPNYFSSLFLLTSLTKLPAFLVYPVFSTGTIALVMLVSTLLFKERPSRMQYFGIGLIMLALILLNL